MGHNASIIGGIKQKAVHLPLSLLIVFIIKDILVKIVVVCKHGAFHLNRLFHADPL